MSSLSICQTYVTTLSSLDKTNRNQGYHTQIGQRGSRLSGGQKQRLAIARSIISNPKVLLLDEATSALDPKAERIVQEALDNVSKNRTTLVIAHKLSTVRKADSIALISKGRVMEQGTHEELIDLGGAYARLVKVQDLGQEKGSFGVEKDAEAERGGLIRAVTSNSVAQPFDDSASESKSTMGYSLLKCLWILVTEQPELRWRFIVTLIACTTAGRPSRDLQCLPANTQKDSHSLLSQSSSPVL